MKSYSESYRKAGVDVTAGYKAVGLIRGMAEKTGIPGVLSGIGGFGGAFDPEAAGFRHPVLVSGTDGVGTKLKVAFLSGKNATVGIDCVAMCVNDIICCGARPLFFLDYIACGKNIPEKIADIVSGVASGCLEAGCSLIGGETAEMPGFYKEDEYDLAGFCVGAVERGEILGAEHVTLGDELVGIASSGIHSNGYSLVRKIFGLTKEKLDQYVPELSDTLGNTLLRPTEIYVKPVLALVKTGGVHALAHITGGGFYENIPRMLPQGMRAVIKKDSFPAPPIFSVIRETGRINEHDMYNTFNMGIGLVAAVPAGTAGTAVRLLEREGKKAYVIGHVSAGEQGVEIC